MQQVKDRLPGFPNAGSVARFLAGLRFPTLHDRAGQIEGFEAARHDLVRAGALPPLTGDEMVALADARARLAKERRAKR